MIGRNGADNERLERRLPDLVSPGTVVSSPHTTALRTSVSYGLSPFAFGFVAIQPSSISAHAWSIALLCSAYSALL